MWFICSLYFLMVCLLRISHPVSGLEASSFVRCSWYCFSMYVFMSSSIGCPLCVNPIANCSSGVAMVSFDGVYFGMLWILFPSGMSAM